MSVDHDDIRSRTTVAGSDSASHLKTIGSLDSVGFKWGGLVGRNKKTKVIGSNHGRNLLKSSTVGSLTTGSDGDMPDVPRKMLLKSESDGNLLGSFKRLSEKERKNNFRRPVPRRITVAAGKAASERAASKDSAGRLVGDAISLLGMNGTRGSLRATSHSPTPGTQQSTKQGKLSDLI